MQDEKLRVLVVEARFHGQIADALLAGATDVLSAHDVEFDVVTVPGELEIPGAIAFADASGSGGGVAYDGYVALGCIIRGETYHFEIMANESARGLMDLTLSRRLCIGNGVLTVDEEDQAWERARASQGDRGGAAARTCVEMISLRARLSGHDQ
ncbi:6,7-dimethyl-8-ribityllumazine synthase [Phenylobacterium sp.]|uniref:6,7-dimethyl-8-ribityllumazine synthase n=1 Tax=Phenylobacterium sp. TaxID=1871053 RepID=UPI002730F3F0|nr:6,7-dimethyl-8-ribityllumazine synthase [Phenylobacterium sp.]MDP1618364.1 6,7-dimethyl-8-ribityllumazine synthase [Phenylobacterium sp.]MDP1985953.1 6,7-dimethyl-8-ribityllumazine synthase [Phenylobacterium sp.]